MNPEPTRTGNPHSGCGCPVKQVTAVYHTRKCSDQRLAVEPEYLPAVDYDAAECLDCLCCRRDQCDRQTCSRRCPCAHD